MRTHALVLTTLLFACAQQEKPLATNGQPATPSTPASATVPVTAGDDPEPPDAQRRAEAVVHDPLNADKTTRLTMSMTTIVGQTSSLEGFASSLAAREEKIEEKLDRLGAKVTDTEVVIQLPGAILFDFDSAKIRPDAESALSDVAQVIQSYLNRPVRVDGHTDTIASDEYNRVLSERRAQAVVEWLVNHGVPHQRLHAAGLGETKPVATNDTAAGRQRNRRVEVVIGR